MRLYKENNVGMGKTSLLKFNSVEKASHVTQDALFKLFDKVLKLGMKDVYHQVRAIVCSLAIKQGILNFWPGSISCHGDEKVTTSKITIDSQCILTLLLHMTGAARK